MTMVTASTALTIFIMNIHHCGPESRPVPQWAERFILNYLARICFVYEVGENCLGGGGASSTKHTETPSSSDANSKGTNQDMNGQVWGSTGEEDGHHVTLQTDWKEDLLETINHSEEGGWEDCNKEKKGTGGERGGVATEGGMVVPGKASCVCQHQGLCRNIQYIANSYHDQRVAQLRIGEWRKVAKVMDRFFMWLFFIMVFVMSILILGKAI